MGASEFIIVVIIIVVVLFIIFRKQDKSTILKESGISCPSCNSHNPSGSKFCSNCSISLSLTCGGCNTENDSSSTYCEKCGELLANDTPANNFGKIYSQNSRFNRLKDKVFGQGMSEFKRGLKEIENEIKAANESEFHTPPSEEQNDSESITNIRKEMEDDYFISSVQANNSIVTQDEIDSILDKITNSGYKHLTAKERLILFNASKKMD